MPDIVYIDDKPEDFMAVAEGEQKSKIQPFSYEENENPEEAFAAAKRAHVWLFDFFLFANRRSEANDENGLSLFQKWRAAVGGGRPTTVLISSALESAVKEPLGPVERHHVVAQARGVEWIGDKSGETLRRLLELADGVNLIAEALQPTGEDGKKFGTYELEQLCVDVLGVPREAEWAHSAQRHVDRARPPREVPIESPAATARVIIGWLISHVLPYPSFLLTDAQAALRLQIMPDSFRSLADAAKVDEQHRATLTACRYTGPLAEFLGRRWWRAGIDDLAWQLSEAEGGFSAALETLAGDVPVERLDGLDEPVLVSDADLVETSEVAEARECVRITDEDFPANVEPAWVRIADVRENRDLAAKVIFEDRDLVEMATS